MYDITKEYIESHTRAEIVAEYGMCEQTLYLICKKLKVKPIRDTLDRKLSQLAGTDTDEAVAEQIGCHRGTVYNYRRKHNIPRCRRGYRGKWTLEYLKELHETYGSWGRASKALGVTKQLLSFHAVELGYSTRFENQREYTKEEIKAIHDKYGTWRKASEALGVRADELSSWYKIYYKDKPKRVGVPCKKGHRKYTIEQLLGLKEKYGTWKDASLALGLSEHALNIMYHKYLKEQKCSDIGSDSRSSAER